MRLGVTSSIPFAEVDKMFTRMYEDRVAEYITEYNFNMLSQKYQMEQIELNDKFKMLKEALKCPRCNKRTWCKKY